MNLLNIRYKEQFSFFFSHLITQMIVYFSSYFSDKAIKISYYIQNKILTLFLLLCLILSPFCLFMLVFYCSSLIPVFFPPFFLPLLSSAFFPFCWFFLFSFCKQCFQLPECVSFFFFSVSVLLLSSVFYHFCSTPFLLLFLLPMLKMISFNYKIA
jgi:hypothetical protein